MILYFQIAMFLKTDVYTNTCLSTKAYHTLTTFLWDLHGFYHEWADMKEALKAVEMLGNFPFSWLKKSLTLHT